jgi:hypothetical protein
MAWTTPLYSRDEVDVAGRALVTPNGFDASELALAVINNWRGSHAFPLNTFQATLRTKARRVEGTALVAQRIKRLSSIDAKLRRYPTMKLSRMQDIGGCRGVLTSVASVDKLVAIYRTSDLKHGLTGIDDYIREPKVSGYRSVHLKYRYFSSRSGTYNGLRIEMQLRSQLQHAWATAVETVGTFIRQALKSSLGEEDWLRFFILMGAWIALEEDTPPVPGAPTDVHELRSEIRSLARRLDVQNRLTRYGEALSVLEQPIPAGVRYFLLELEPLTHRMTIRGYNIRDLQRATIDYMAIERANESKEEGADAVLVAVDSLAALRRAYPNYFLDTVMFLEAVTRAVEEARSAPKAGQGASARLPARPNARSAPRRRQRA